MTMPDPFSMSLSDLTSDDAVEVLELALSDVQEDPDQPRDDLDTPKAREALAGLAETIKARGVLQPIAVRPRDANGKWVIRFGHRRYRASLLAGLSTIPAIERAASSTEDDLYDQVIENEQRSDLNAVQMARFVRKALDRGQKPAEIARRLGKPKSKISELIAIGDLAPELETYASGLGSRTLAELQAAYKLDAVATLAFVRDNVDEGITQAAARSFAASLKAPPSLAISDDGPPVTDLENDESLAATAPGERSDASAPSPLPSPADLASTRSSEAPRPLTAAAKPPASPAAPSSTTGNTSPEGGAELSVIVPVELQRLAASVGMTPQELLENFIRDLCELPGNNGSDERSHAEAWFGRVAWSVDRR